jgi:hypothetical protein
MATRTVHLKEFGPGDDFPEVEQDIGMDEEFEEPSVSDLRPVESMLLAAGDMSFSPDFQDL